MGFKEELFAYYTFLLSYICFNFNRLKKIILSTISFYLDDDKVYPINPPGWFPYHYKNPVRVVEAKVDGKKFTNKMQLILNWYWDNDTRGISVANILTDGLNISIHYILSGNQYKINIDLNKKTINGNDITFGLIELDGYHGKICEST